MKKNILFYISSVLFLFTNAEAQVVLPKFSTPVKMESLSNENAEESMPLPFNDGKGVYFFRTYISGTGEKAIVTGQDIWVSKLAGSDWEKPYRVFRTDNSGAQSSIIGTDSTGSTIYLFTTNFTKDTVERYLSYVVNERKNKWSEPEKIIIPGLEFSDRFYSFFMNSTADILMISMSPSEKNLNEDLFVSLKDKNGNWGKPINLGPKINTKRYEVSPFISKDRKTLFFSSDGHKGYGLSDIFVSYRLDDTWKNWSTPLNMGEPINSSDLDIGFIMGNKNDIFFISDRKSNHNNIYTSKADKEVVIARPQTVNVQFFVDKSPLKNVAFTIEKAEGELVNEMTTDNQGKISYQKMDIEKDYVIKTEKPKQAGAKAYYVNDKGEKVKRFILTESGNFVDSESLNSKMEAQGKYEYNNEAVGNADLVVFDENNYSIDTIRTDDNGQFSYALLQYDKEFTVVPIKNEVQDWKKVDLYLTGNDGEKVKQLVKSSKGFAFVPIMREVADQESGSMTGVGIDREFINGAEIEVEAWSAMDKKSRELYFNFSEIEPAKNELNKVSPLISIMKYDNSLKLELVGHTDNVGSSKRNKEVGLERANAVKQYITSKGIAANRITVKSEGEKNPEYNNSTEAGRKQNRRVEMSVK